MRRHVPVLHIAIVSACEHTACDLAERIFERGQVAHVFTDARALCEWTELPVLDVILLDRRGSGFAMALHALRSIVRAIPSYVSLCGFGPGTGIVPVGLDHSFDTTLSDSDLSCLLGEIICGQDDNRLLERSGQAAGQLVC